MAEVTIVSSTTITQPTGSARQAHVIYATNSGRWWLFYLSSTTVLATYYSSDGTTWTAGGTFTLPQAAGEGGDFGAAYANISSHDVVHFSYDPPGTGSDSYHLRATISGTTISFDAAVIDETFITGVGYEAGTAISSTGRIADFHTDNGNPVGSIWPNVDSGTSWTAGSETDTSLRNCTASIFSGAIAPLGATSYLAIYDDGNNLSSYGSTSYGLQWSQYNGTSWSADAAISGITATNEHINSWGVCHLSDTDIHLVHRSGSNTYEHLRFNGSSWSSGSSIPTQTSKDSAGCVLTSDGTNVWLFVVDSATGNAVKYIKWNGSTWDASWSTLESTSATRDYLSVCPQVHSSTIQVIWTEGTASPWKIAGEQLSTSGGGTSHGSATIFGMGGIFDGLAAQGLIGRGLANGGGLGFGLAGGGAVGGGLAGVGNVSAKPAASTPATFTGEGVLGGGIAGQGNVNASSAATPSLTFTGMGALMANLFGGQGIISAAGTLGGAIHGAATLLGMGAALLGFGGHGNLSASSAATPGETLQGSGSLGGGLAGSGGVNASPAASTPATFQGSGAIGGGAAGSGHLNSSGAATPGITFHGMGALLTGLFAGSGILPPPAAHITGLIAGIFRWLYTAAYNVLSQSFVAQNHQTMVFGGTAYLLMSFVLEPDVMVTPNSTIQVVMTAKKFDGTLMSGLQTVTCTVTFPDGTTSAFSLGSGIVNTGSGTYTLTYQTKMAGENIEDWVGTDTSGNTAEFHNITPVSF